MEILNNLWVALTTENEMLINIFSIPLTALESLIDMLLFTLILNISPTKHQKILYISFSTILGVICTCFIPKPYSNFITICFILLLIIFVFKLNFFQGLIAEFIILISITISELIVDRISFIIFKLPYESWISIPLYRLLSTLSIYLLLFMCYKLIKLLNFHIKFNTMNKRNKLIIIFNTIMAIIVIFIQIYLIMFYTDKLPLFVIIINILSLFAYFFISLYSLVKTMNLEKAKEELEQEKMYNKTLQILHDNVRAFKHDFANIIAGIGGYVETNDMDGLKRYYKQLLQDCGQVNNLSSLNPDTINNPAVYAVLANKYYKADNLGIKITLETFIDFSKLYMDIYEFTRITGILMDNAIEASSECDKKLINVTIRNDPRQHRQLLIIENTYANKDINLEKIYDKGFSTKPKNTGLGLWEVNKIISKHKNLARYTTKTDEFFRQQIEIYEK